MIPLACFLALSVPQEGAAPVVSPGKAVLLAAADGARLPADLARRCRYLWLGNGTAKEKQELWQVLSVWCNVLSKEPDLVRPVVILASGQPAEGLTLAGESWAGAMLLRINLDDYGWKAATWDKLAEQDPYFYTRLIKEEEVLVDRIWKGGVYTDGKEYPAGTPYKVYEKRKGQPILALAPWVGDDTKSLTVLTAATGTQVPILYAPGFLWQVGIQTDRKVGFYGLMEVKNRVDFQRLVGFDEKLSKEFTRELLAAVSNSGVSRQPRRIARFEKLGGGYWSTFDSREAIDKNNPLRVLNGGFQHDAEEVFAHGSNGLWKVGLFAADGTRQDSAPDFVGFDRTTHSNDGRIHIGLSCFRCHHSDKSEDGLKPIKDWARNLFKPPLALTGPDYDQLKKLRQSYLRRLEPYLAGDRVRHAESIRECSGLTTLEFGSALSRVWAAYDAPVDLVRSAAELGVPAEQWRIAIDAYVKRAGQVDTVLGMYARPLAQQEALPLETWQESYYQAQTILRSIR